MNGICDNLTAEQAREWASRRWGRQATTSIRPHPRSYGNYIARIVVRDQNAGTFVGVGYGSTDQQKVSIWTKAATDLCRQEPQAAGCHITSHL